MLSPFYIDTSHEHAIATPQLQQRKREKRSPLERPHSLLRYQTPDKYEEMYYFYNPNRTSMVKTEEEN